MGGFSPGEHGSAPAEAPPAAGESTAETGIERKQSESLARKSTTKMQQLLHMDDDFYQQRLKGWQPVQTTQWATIAFFLVGVLSLIIGAVLVPVNASVQQHYARYDDKPDCAIPGRCTVDVTVSKLMKAPVYVYYELTKYYQNHRRYVSSRNNKQLLGEVITDESLLQDCQPQITSGDGRILQPCGLIANSFFNDTFVLTSPASIQMLESDISWASDRSRFAAVPASVQDQYRKQVSHQLRC